MSFQTTRILSRLRTDRAFRLSLDFKPATFEDRMVLGGIGDDSVEIAHHEGRMIVLNHTRQNYTVA